jgi:hypothetical protein
LAALVVAVGRDPGNPNRQRILVTGVTPCGPPRPINAPSIDHQEAPMADKPDPQEALLPLAKLKPLVGLAETKPVSIAFGLTKEKTALLLLNKTAKPKKVAAQLKSDAKASLELNSLRFGRITIDKSDPDTVRFSVNKTEVGGTITALLRLIKRTGYQGIVINPDTALQTESEDDAEAPSDQSAPPQSAEPPPPPAEPPPPPPAATRAAPPANPLDLGKAGSNGAAVALTKSVLLWDATRKYLEGQIKPLQQAILEASTDEDDFEAIKSGTPVLEKVMERLDARLSAKLNQIHTTPDQAIRVQLRKEAKDIVTEYEGYIASEPLVGALDGNPFISFDGVARVQATLKAIATYL